MIPSNKGVNKKIDARIIWWCSIYFSWTQIVSVRGALCTELHEDVRITKKNDLHIEIADTVAFV